MIYQIDFAKKIGDVNDWRIVGRGESEEREGQVIVARNEYKTGKRKKKSIWWADCECSFYDDVCFFCGRRCRWNEKYRKNQRKHSWSRA